MFRTIIQMLNGDSMFQLSREPATVHDTIKGSTPDIPDRFRSDIETLRQHFGENFVEGLEISLSLKEALDMLPRDRKRTDAYTSLASWMEANLCITLKIKSQKTK